MNHIELFAGCGGLSLGLERCGFQLVLANEVSPMAAETFAYNLLSEDFQKHVISGAKPVRVLWLNSRHSSLADRLRENPFHFPPFDGAGFSDLPLDKRELEGKLLVGSIVEINRLLESDDDFVHLLKSAFHKDGGLDLVSGGPPCQSFSLAGLRRKDCEKNSLPWEFAKFVKLTQPKVALLENVTGILRPFKDVDGNEFHAWYEVAKTFASIGYVPICLHVNARFVGVAQNRPRFIMLALRHDHFLGMLTSKKLNLSDKSTFNLSLDFYRKVESGGDALPFGHLDYIDLTKNVAKDDSLSSSFLSNLVGTREVSVKEAIDDLKVVGASKKSRFVNELNRTFHLQVKSRKVSNHELRSNSDLVRRRFRLYQVLAQIDDRSVSKEIYSILKGNISSLSDQTWRICSSYSFLQEGGSFRPFRTKKAFASFLNSHQTKKQTQRALNAFSPAPAALSIPDDACHYDENELRTLTVREMARIQSFPDGFEFRSKVTTGGQMRRFEVPQYTQVGNAVPPLLGIALGKTITKLLDTSRVRK